MKFIKSNLTVLILGIITGVCCYYSVVAALGSRDTSTIYNMIRTFILCPFGIYLYVNPAKFDFFGKLGSDQGSSDKKNIILSKAIGIVLTSINLPINLFAFGPF